MYVLMAETILSELRRELEQAKANPHVTDDQFVETAGEVRKLLRTALAAYESGEFKADLVEFVAPARRLVARIDATLGVELSIPGVPRA